MITITDPKNKQHRCCPLTIREHIKWGKASGYPWCDIVYFLIRAKFIDFICKYKYTEELWMVYWAKYTESTFFKKVGSDHVLCPVCAISQRIFGEKVEYVVCAPCDWKQLAVLPMKCNLCKGDMEPYERD